MFVGLDLHLLTLYICNFEKKGKTVIWSTLPPILTKWTNFTSNLKSLNIKKTITYDIGNPTPGWRQTQKCGRDKQVNEIPTLLPSWQLDLQGQYTCTYRYIYKQLRIDCKFCSVHEEITSIRLYTPCNPRITYELKLFSGAMSPVLKDHFFFVTKVTS